MSGSSGSAPCPECGAKMHTYVDWKPFDYVSGECLECGFHYYTADGQMNLDEVNEARGDLYLPPIEKLRDQKQGG